MPQGSLSIVNYQLPIKCITIMKKLLLLLLAALGGSMSASAQFSLSGRIDGMPDSLRVTVVNMENPDKQKLICETFPKSGAFMLASDSLVRPTLCELRISRKSPKSGRYYTLYSARFMASSAAMTLQPTSMDTLESASKDSRTEQAFRVSGGQAQVDWNAFQKATFELERAERLAGYKEAEIYFATRDNKDSVRKYRDIQKEAERKLYRARMDFTRRHPQSMAAAYWMNQYIRTYFVRTADELKEMAALVQACPDTARVNRVNRDLDIALRYALEQPYTDFDLTLADGRKSRLSALIPAEAQYTMIDFWASWCGPCRAAIPHVKELAAQYGARLGLLSVSVDQKEADWRKAMGEEKMTWAQGWLDKEQMDKPANAYALIFIPRLILIDREGRIVCSTNLPDEITEYLQKHITQ